MRVYRGRADDPTPDRERTERMLSRARDGTPSVRVWSPPRQVAFGRRDAREPNYETARRAAADAGYVPIERDVGGRAVAYTGRTLAFAAALPSDSGAAAGGIKGRYDRVSGIVASALETLGASVVDGEPAASFCPGAHSLRVAGPGGKVAGFAQRVRSDAVLVAGCLVVTREEAAALGSVLGPVYDALDLPFDPAAVGCIADAGGPSDHRSVARGVESGLVRTVRSDRGRCGPRAEGAGVSDEPDGGLNNEPGDEPSNEPSDGRVDPSAETVRVGYEPW